MKRTHDAGWKRRLDRLDAEALAWVAKQRHPALVKAMQAVTHTGEPPVLTSALALAAGLWPGRRMAQVTAATTAAFAASSVVKRVWRRKRPHGRSLVEPPDRFSMPSGHTAVATAVAVVLSALTPSLAPLAVGWALAVGASRVVLGVHYPSDVLAGAALGGGAAAVVLATTPAKSAPADAQLRDG